MREPLPGQVWMMLFVLLFAWNSHAACRRDADCGNGFVCAADRSCVRLGPLPVSLQDTHAAHLWLDRQQMAALSLAGAAFDAHDAEIARQLASRGFRAEDFVAAYQDYQTFHRYYGPEHVRRSMIVTYAIARALGLDDWQRYTMGRATLHATLTEAHNETVAGNGATARTAGIVLGVIGTIVGALGVAGMLSKEDPDSGSEIRDQDSGAVLLAVGGALALGGLVSWGAGTHKRGRPLPMGTLEGADANRLRAMGSGRKGPPPSPGSSFRLFPKVGRDQGGLRLVVSF